MEAVLKYLDKIDPEAARRARYRYSCFEAFRRRRATLRLRGEFRFVEYRAKTEAVNQLIDLQRRAADYMNRDGFVARDEYFFAEQNARLVKNAEEYYREMFRGRVSSWNLRDRHMTETLHALAAHLETQGQPPKIVVWAHNSHLGDARATDMSERGEWNVGQLVREKLRRRRRLYRIYDLCGNRHGGDELGRTGAAKKSSSRNEKQLRTSFSSKPDFRISF